MIAFEPFDRNSLAPVTFQVHFLEPIFYEEYKDLKTTAIAELVRERIVKTIAEQEKEAALNLIAGTWYTVGGMPYNLKAEFSGDDMKAYLPDSAEIYFERIVQTVFKTSYGYFYVIDDSKDDFSNQYGYRLETEYPESMYIIDTANPFAPAESMTDSLCRDNGKLSN